MEVHPTGRTLEVFRLVRDEAVRRGDDRVRAQHMLYGLATVAGTAAASALEWARVDREALRALLDARVPHGESGIPHAEMPYAAECGRVLKRMMDRATTFGLRQMSTAHVLHGMLLDADPWLHEVLREVGADVDALMRYLESEPPDPE